MLRKPPTSKTKLYHLTADISRCLGGDCTLKNKCLRFLSYKYGNEMRVPITMFTHTESTPCKSFEETVEDVE